MVTSQWDSDVQAFDFRDDDDEIGCSCRQAIDQGAADQSTSKNVGDLAGVGRRAFVMGALAVPLAAPFQDVLARPEGGLSRPSGSILPEREKRRLKIVRARDKAVLDVLFYDDGSYDSAAFLEIADFMRDMRSGRRHPIDPNLVDLLYVMDQIVGRKGPFHLVSGYRSLATNNALRRTQRRVARNSLHMEGKAADIKLPGVDIRPIRDAALRLAAGGVGYYGPRGHLHLDVGPVRAWPRYLNARLNS